MIFTQKNDPDCFCRDPDNCHPSGTLDLSLCLEAPLIRKNCINNKNYFSNYYNKTSVSKPHFLDADPSLLQKVKGLVPDEEKYDIIADFELVCSVNNLCEKNK